MKEKQGYSNQASDFKYCLHTLTIIFHLWGLRIRQKKYTKNPAYNSKEPARILLLENPTKYSWKI